MQQLAHCIILRVHLVLSFDVPSTDVGMRAAVSAALSAERRLVELSCEALSSFDTRSMVALGTALKASTGAAASQ